MGNFIWLETGWKWAGTQTFRVNLWMQWYTTRSRVCFTQLTPERIIWTILPRKPNQPCYHSHCVLLDISLLKGLYLCVHLMADKGIVGVRRDLINTVQQWPTTGMCRRAASAWLLLGASSVCLCRNVGNLFSLAYPTDPDFNCFLNETMGVLVS